MLEDIKNGNKKTKWKERVPYAYWKGNPNVTPTRKNLMTCNLTDKDDWNTRLYIQVFPTFSPFFCSVIHFKKEDLYFYYMFLFWSQDWDQESQQGFKQSNLGDQCTHR